MSVGDNCPNSCWLQPLNSLPVEAAKCSHQGGPLARVPRTVQLCRFLELQGGAVSAEVYHALLGTAQPRFTNLTVVQGYSPGSPQHKGSINITHAHGVLNRKTLREGLEKHPEL